VGTHAYEQDIPDTVRKDRVFPISLLHLAADDPLPGQIQPPPLPVVIDGEEEWEVEEILDSRRVRNQLLYLVRWRGYPDPTWESEDNLAEVEAIDRFYEQHPEKPHPNMVAAYRASQELST